MRPRPCRLAAAFVLALALAAAPAAGEPQAPAAGQPQAPAAPRPPAPPAPSGGPGEVAHIEAEVQRLLQAGQPVDALALAVRGVMLAEQRLGPNHPLTVALLTSRAGALQALGRWIEADADYRHALQRAEKALGPKDIGLTTILLGLGAVKRARGDYAAAEACYRRALALAEQAGPVGRLGTAVVLNNLAVLFQEQGDLARAEEHLGRALPALEAGLGPDHPAVANLMGNLGVLQLQRGDYGRAQATLERALAILEKARGVDHPEVATVLDNLAQVHQRRGDLAHAEPLFARALRIRERVLGPAHLAVATTVNNLGLVFYQRGDLARAEQSFTRALGIAEKALGPRHPYVAACLSNLAEVYRARRQPAKAEPASRRALAIVEAAFGPRHPEVATALNNLAGVVLARGDEAEGQRLLERAVAAAEATLGPRHPATAAYLSNLARLRLLRGDAAQAIALEARAEDAFEHHASLVLRYGTDEQRQAFMATLGALTDFSVSLHVQAAPASEAAARLALTTVLRRKARAVDAVAASLGALRQRLRPADRAVLDQLGAARARLARAVLGGERPDPARGRGRLAALEAEVERLEGRLAARSAELRVAARPVTVATVQAELPPGAALVELARYYPFDPRGARDPDRAWGKARYVAYVVRRSGPIAWRDLGEASAIEAAAARLRDALQAPDRADARELGRRLDELVTRPLRPLLAGAAPLLVAPDGPLTVVPFGALVDEQGRYLVETQEISYLTSGRDLLRLKLAARPRQPPVIFAAPDFDAAPAPAAQPHAAPTAAAAPAAARSLDFARARFAPLPGTADEAREVARLLRHATVRTGAAATEEQVKRLAGPELVHLATHGFFLDDGAARRPGSALSVVGALGAPTRESPLVRAGLVLAGANRRRVDGADGPGGPGGPAADDGLLTALEAAGLDLVGTRLVVMSACETGLGAVRAGDGVHGLRRALTVAGAAAQVMSLWKVDDQATRELMVAFYRRLTAGAGRGAALRAAQLEVRGRPGRAHPYYWAGFIHSGDWRRLGE